MRANIEPRPIEDRLNVGCLDRHLRRDRRAIEREQAEAHARENALQRSAAVHYVDISSANIPAVSFVFTANRPARCHQRNEMKPSILLGSIGFPVVAVKSHLEKSPPHFQTPFETHPT